MDLRQSCHGCAEINAGLKAREEAALIAVSEGRVNRPETAYFFGTVVSLTDVDPVATGAPAGGGGAAAAKFGGGLAAT